MIDLSICIPTYNRHEHLLNCLNSIVISSQNKKIDLLIEHLDPSGSISETDSNPENSDSTDILELLQIVQNKFNEIDLAVSGSDSLFINIH